MGESVPEIAVIPDPDTPAIEEAIDEAAATLESIQDAIEGEAVLSHDRAEEILREVRTCQTNLQTLSSSATAESPTLQLVLTQLQQLQSAVAALQVEISRLPESPPQEPPIAAVVIDPAREGGPERATISSNPSGNLNQNPESNPSATPPPPPATRKRRYVKI
jgi:hypothetical protein